MRLVINTNLPPLLHRFQVWLIIGQIFASDMVLLHFNAPAANILINFTSPETRMIVLRLEDRTIVSSFVWTKHGNVMDRRTDGRTP